ncbi:magnesium transporter [Catalinimonas alkaloidigena]|uniref:magnesium transporter n=1 Tax=Catalinimonas alkaloidigena TaxID=1075417 RepID=UPI0024058D23|nr:magnesium transporter [Catalinimonas alkaloidigena]MDF9795811.1 magnesium transporter [Catalinimonas alkaloidigena]
MEQISTSSNWEKLKEIIELRDKQRLEEHIESISTAEMVHAMAHLDKEDQLRLLNLLSPDYSAYLFEEIPDAQASELIEKLSAEKAATIIQEMWSNDQADLISSLEKEDAEAILAKMSPEEAEEVRRLARYADDTAGGLMITEFLVFPESDKVSDVIEDMNEHAEEYSDYNVQYCYVKSVKNKLIGVLRLRDLLLSPPRTPIRNIMLKNILSVPADQKLDQLLDFFEEHDFVGVPVTDYHEQLVGVVLRKDVLEAAADRSDAELMRTRGIVGGEELRSMPLFLRSRRRLSWLSVNIVLNVIAASVIAIYQDTLSSVIALAVFLPIISDMSGCSGNQAVAVSMRELSLNILKPNEIIRVVWQELSVGIINGIVLGVLIGIAAWIWKGNPYLGIVVGGALALNTLVAVGLGGAIPLFLKRIGMDPALASSPILTTVTDMFGFFLVLSLASVMLPLLT